MTGGERQPFIPSMWLEAHLVGWLILVHFCVGGIREWLKATERRTSYGTRLWRPGACGYAAGVRFSGDGSLCLAIKGGHGDG